MSFGQKVTFSRSSMPVAESESGVPDFVHEIEYQLSHNEVANDPHDRRSDQDKNQRLVFMFDILSGLKTGDSYGAQAAIA